MYLKKSSYIGFIKNVLLYFGGFVPMLMNSSQYSTFKK